MQKDIVLKNYLSYLKNLSDKKNNTITAYFKDSSDLLNFIDCEVEEINKIKIEKFLNYLRKEEFLSEKTLSRKLNSMRNFCSYLKEKKIIPVNYAQNIEHGKSEKNLPRVLNREEIVKLRESSKNNFISSLLVELIIQTGLKISELVKIQTIDINIGKEKSYIQIGDRDLLLNRKIMLFLDYYLDTIHERKSKYLFYTSTGKYIHVRNIRNMVDEVILKSGLVNVTVNDLRNTFIYYQLHYGVPTEIVKVQANLTTQASLNRYLNLLEEEYNQEDYDSVIEI